MNEKLLRELDESIHFICKKMKQREGREIATLAPVLKDLMTARSILLDSKKSSE